MAPPTKRPEAEATRQLWLTYPKRVIQRPVVYELGHKFRLITNIRQANVTAASGHVSLELVGRPTEINRAILWLKRLRIKVEPVATSSHDH